MLLLQKYNNNGAYMLSHRIRYECPHGAPQRPYSTHYMRIYVLC